MQEWLRDKNKSNYVLQWYFGFIEKKKKRKEIAYQFNTVKYINLNIKVDFFALIHFYLANKVTNINNCMSAISHITNDYTLSEPQIPSKLLRRASSWILENLQFHLFMISSNLLCKLYKILYNFVLFFI